MIEGGVPLLTNGVQRYEFIIGDMHRLGLQISANCTERTRGTCARRTYPSCMFIR